MKLLIYGKGSYSKLLLSLFNDRLSIASKVEYIDDTQKEEASIEFKSISEFKYKHSRESLAEYKQIVAIGNHYGFERAKYSEQLLKLGINQIKLWHTSSLLLPDTTVAKSTIIHPGSIVMPYTKVDEYCIINTGAKIDHECYIGKGCHIMGNAYIAGRVLIDNFSTIGSQAVVFPDIKIGKNCYIGAGSVVRTNIPDNSIYAGNPAKFIKHSRMLTYE